jgi:hypothetical protein
MLKVWTEASNRRLRALVHKRCSLNEAAVRLDCSPVEVNEQLRRLGVRRPALI